MAQQTHEAQANRLIHETSPYLLQHAHNPVDWHPWGREAFEEARRRDVPILVSIGYSTCYWCHVMERECFENEAIARVMNENLVCIKVDREERPDVDDLYMTALQILSGSGGWPLNMFIEPASLKPIWGGTYFPPEANPKFGNRPSWPQIVRNVNQAWRSDREGMLEQAENLGAAVADQIGQVRRPVRIGQDQVAQAVSMLLNMHDRANGGFGRAPKFPQPAYLELLLTFRDYAGDDETRRGTDGAIRLTLERMALGGMFDQVGGGFHRYSVDERWLVPHFEKMLYDNGQLAAVYAVAAREYDEPLFRRVAQRSCEYVLREMTSPEGAFFSAQDAEVNHREGQNYLWTLEQMEQVLGAEDAALAAEAYGVKLGPNFQDPHHPDDPPANVLYLPQRAEQIAARLGMEEHALLGRLERINSALYEARLKRDQPGLDDKILTGWNGLMIAGLATTGRLLADAGGDRFIEAARRAAEFILREMRDERDGLLRSHRAGTSKIPAFCEDYALLVRGLLALHRAGRDEAGEYLDRALALVAEAEHLFGDAETGAWYDTRAEQEDLFVRAASLYDGAIPSPTSVMLNNLIDLYEITGDDAHLQRAISGLRACSAFLARSPVGACGSTRALLRLLAIDDEAVAAAQPADAAAAMMPGAAPEDAVKVLADREVVTVGADKPDGLVLRIEIDEGFHINAANPGGDGLVPFRVFIAHGTGVKAYADYPKGTPYSPAWVEADDEAAHIQVYTGTIDVPVVLERAGDFTGTPVIALTYQVCSDEACFTPSTVELDVSIERE